MEIFKLTYISNKENSSCGRTYATITITSLCTTPEEITQLLKLEPCVAKKIGDRIVGDRRHTENMWKYSSQGEVESKDISHHFNYLFDLLDERKLALLELISKQCKLGFFVFWESCAYAGCGGGPTLSVETMRRAVELQADISFDLYFDFSDDE